MPARFGLGGRLFIDITDLGKVNMAEESVVIDDHLAIQRDQPLVFRDPHWIDLRQRRIRLEIRPPQPRSDLTEVAPELARQVDGGGNIAGLEIAQTQQRIDMDLDDL